MFSLAYPHLIQVQISIMMIIKHLVFSLALIMSIRTKPVPMQATPNEKYTRTGQFGMTLNSVTAQHENMNFDIPYKMIFQQKPGIALLSIDRLDFNIVDNLIDFNVRLVQYLPSKIMAQLSSSCMSRISIIAVRYYVAVGKYADPNIFQTTTMNNQIINQQLSLNSSYSYSTTSTLNSTNTGKFYFISGLNATSATNSFDVRLLLLDNNTDRNKTILQIGSDIADPTYVRSISWSILKFDKTKTNDPSFGFFNVDNGTYGNAVNDMANRYVKQTVRDYNTITGIYHLRLINSTNFNVDINIQVNQVNISVQHACIQIMTMQTYYCPQNTPFLLESEMQCYDECPWFKIKDQQTLTCELNYVVIVIISTVVGIFSVVSLVLLVGICCQAKSKIQKNLYQKQDQPRINNQFSDPKDLDYSIQYINDPGKSRSGLAAFQKQTKKLQICREDRIKQDLNDDSICESSWKL